ncbi:MAG: dienelactone hydrolase family protein [Archangium sp.]|nr:dienelactone hydrolase family protein [Archangium sp.]
MSRAVLLPGFNGSAEQAILLKLEKALGADFECTRLAPPRLKLTADLTAHVDWLEERVKDISAPILIGRSFGGRLALRLAARRKLKAVVLLGFPIRPPGKPRPLDEEALAAVRCPTLIMQGSKDELGPLKIFKPIVAANSALTLEVLKGAGHSFGSKEKAAIEHVAKWMRLL